MIVGRSDLPRPIYWKKEITVKWVGRVEAPTEFKVNKTYLVPDILEQFNGHLGAD